MSARPISAQLTEKKNQKLRDRLQGISGSRRTMEIDLGENSGQIDWYCEPTLTVLAPKSFAETILEPKLNGQRNLRKGGHP
jgi:hypothetical protein